jgi:hypothetical protein
MHRASSAVDTKSAMHDLAAHAKEGRGPELILLHCMALTRIDEVRAPAYRRLERAAGRELARLLVSALSPGRHVQRLAA